jgi:hypothetical protein
LSYKTYGRTTQKGLILRTVVYSGVITMELLS